MSPPVIAAVGPLIRTVRCLDGRTLELRPGYGQSIKTDLSTRRLDLDWIDMGTSWGPSCFQAIVHLLQSRSIDTTCSYNYVFRRLALEVLCRKNHPESPICLADAETIPQVLPITYWERIQSFLRIMQYLRLPGIDDDLLQFLDNPAKWEQEEGGWYVALLTNDPHRGALTGQELQSILSGVTVAYQKGRITERDYAVVMFFIGTGVRPIQVARMRVSDIAITPGVEQQEVTLAIPLAKGKRERTQARWKRRAPTQLAEILIGYLERHHADSSADAPLFADQSVKVGQIVHHVFQRVETFSARLKGPIPITTYRFRYTLATRALADGASDHEVARLLMHRSTYCIRFYRASMPMLQNPIKQAIGEEMEYIARAFQGRLIKNLGEATRANDRTALIRDFERLLGQAIGACGTCAECYQDAPIACLICTKFEPFDDAPWEELLDYIQREIALEKEDQIASVLTPHYHALLAIIGRRDERRKAA